MSTTAKTASTGANEFRHLGRRRPGFLSEVLGTSGMQVSAGLAIVSLFSVLALLAPWIAPHDPTQTGPFFLMPPDNTHWLGTDELGRDVFSRLLHGGRVSISVGLGAALIATCIGLPLGLVAGYNGGKYDLAIMQVANLFIALPSLVLALMITAMVGPTLINIILVLGLVGWPRVARLVRGQVLALREMVYIEAARAAGGSDFYIMVHHLLPNTRRIVAAQFSLTVAYAMVTSASLSFLGLGIPPPEPDWGGMVRAGVPYLAMSPLISLSGSATVSLTVLGFYLIGSGQK
ncbi:MAG: ABC transporter permease [Mesorhizobium sp.]|nr:ABC transporter permease [Mesorhizobium sp.]